MIFFRYFPPFIWPRFVHLSFHTFFISIWASDQLYNVVAWYLRKGRVCANDLEGRAVRNMLHHMYPFLIFAHCHVLNNTDIHNLKHICSKMITNYVIQQRRCKKIFFLSLLCVYYIILTATVYQLYACVPVLTSEIRAFI